MRRLPIDIDGPVRTETFVVARAGEGLVLTGPDGPQPWLAESHPPEHPLDTVRRLATQIMDDVLLIHSTSWRYEAEAVVLSFVAVVGSTGTMAAVPVDRVELARSGAKDAPDSIGHRQVLEHGIRHLAWLATEDAVVSATLDEGWHTALDAYVPEPFRQL